MTHPGGDPQPSGQDATTTAEDREWGWFTIDEDLAHWGAGAGGAGRCFPLLPREEVERIRIASEPYAGDGVSDSLEWRYGGKTLVILSGQWDAYGNDLYDAEGRRIPGRSPGPTEIDPTADDLYAVGTDWWTWRQVAPDRVCRNCRRVLHRNDAGVWVASHDIVCSGASDPETGLHEPIQ